MILAIIALAVMTAFIITVPVIAYIASRQANP